MNYFSHSLLAVALAGMMSLPGYAADTSININTANAQQIAEVLDGVGLSKARAIVEYRDTKGPFKSSTGLLAGKGIGEATLKRNVEKITLDN